MRHRRIWGLHFDFHATLDDLGEIGKDLTREMIETIIDKARPDYIQVDCKGHPGIASYPTEVGVPARTFHSDPLKLWREVTAEKGVALLVHFSGIWDFEMVKRQPEWASHNAEGQPSKESTSTFGPYAQESLIPQLKEIIDRYDVDGVWIDGDCWGVELDYSAVAIQKFREAYSFTGPIPQVPGDSGFESWSEFNRDGFRAYLRTITKQLHKHSPCFQIASNWAYSSFMPEPVGSEVDFLSGDLSPQNSVNSARLEARVIAGQGRSWDLMSWSFNKVPGDLLLSTKSAVQIMQEAAVVTSLGGGFQLYLKQRRDASVHLWPMDTLAEVEKLIRARQPWCGQAELVPQVGVLLSRHALYQTSGRVFGPWKELLDGVHGALQALLEAGQVVDIVMEHTLEERLGSYPLIVIPEWGHMEELIKQRLITYVEQGGKLLLIGPDAVKLFACKLGIGELKQAGKERMWLSHEERMSGLETPIVYAEATGFREVIGQLYEENDSIGPSLPAATIIPMGQGEVGCVWFSFGNSFLTKRTSVQRDFLGSVTRRLFSKPMVEVQGAHYHAVDVVLTRDDGRLILHLINTSGPHADANISVYDDLQPIGPLHVRIREVDQPQRILLQPRGVELQFGYQEKELIIHDLNVHLHEIVVIEF